MSSHGFHRFTQILRVRCSPTEFTEFTEFVSVGMAGMPYPPTSVRIRAHLWEALLCKRFCAFRAFCGNLFSPTDFTDLHRCLWCAVLPQNSQNTQNLAAWVWQGCHTLLRRNPWEDISVGGSVNSAYSVGEYPIAGGVGMARCHTLLRRNPWEDISVGGSVNSAYSVG